MKGYLLLQDGSLFLGEIFGKSQNILGETVLNDENAVTITCPLTGKQGLIVNCSDCGKGNIVLSNEDFKCLKLKIQKNKTILSKIVTDSLPIDYHVYDLKTFVTSGLK